MAGAAIVGWPEWNLAVAHLMRVEIGLEDAIDGRLGVVPHRYAVRPAPDAAIAISHAAGILGIRNNRSQQLAVPVQQPGLLAGAVMALLLQPETLVMVGGDGV